MYNEESIIDYLNGELTPIELEKLEQQLQSDTDLQQMVEDYKLLFGHVATLPTHQPSEEMHVRFDNMLSREISMAEQAKVVPLMRRVPWYKLAAAAVALIVGVLAGINYTQRSLIGRLDEQNYALQQQMIENIDSKSITGRIQAVNVSQEITQPNKEVIDILIQTLTHDESSHVRLAAAEALGKYAEEPKVRRTMVQQLTQEEDQYVLITLIDVLSQVGDTRAIEPLEKLTESNLEQSVKDEAYIGLMKIQKL